VIASGVAGAAADACGDAEGRLTTAEEMLSSKGSMPNAMYHNSDGSQTETEIKIEDMVPDT